MSQSVLIRNARAIVTCDQEDRVYYDADLLIQGPKIVKIGRDLKDQADQVVDAHDKFVYPGLVNTHHHFFQTFVRNLRTIDYPNMTVPEWLDKIYRIFQVIDGDVIFYSSLTAMADLLKHGCTCAFDHQYCFTKATGTTPVDRQMEAAKLLGIRYHAGRGVNTLPREKGSTMPENMLETTDGFLRDCERIIRLYHDPAPYSMSRIVMAPCQPMNCYKETFVETVDFARKHGVRMHTHLGEGENATMVERWGKRTLDWCGEDRFHWPGRVACPCLGIDAGGVPDAGKNRHRHLALPHPGDSGRVPHPPHEAASRRWRLCQPGLRRLRHQRRLQPSGRYADRLDDAGLVFQGAGRVHFPL